MRNIWISLLLLLFQFGCQIVEDGPAPEDYFVKYYGDTREHEAVDLLVNSSGEYIMFGTVQSAIPTSGRDYYIVRADAAGNVLDEIVWPYSSLNEITNMEQPTDQEAMRIREVSDGYLLIGSVAFLDGVFAQESSRLFAAKLGFDLSFENAIILDLWPSDVSAADDKRIDFVNSSSGSVGGADIIETTDGSILFVGYSDVPETNNDVNATWGRQMLIGHYLIENGAFVKNWRKTLGSRNSDEDALYVREVSNSFTVIGSSNSGKGDDGARGANVAFWNVNNIGNISDYSPQHGMTLNGNNASNDIPKAVFRDNGGFVITGTSSLGATNKAFELITNDFGVLIYKGVVDPDFTTDSDDFNMQGLGVTRATDGNYAICGIVEDFNVGTRTYENQMMFLKTSQTATLIEGVTAKHFGNQNGDDEAKDIAVSSDGGLAMLGTADLGAGVKLFSLFKLNTQGEITR